MDGSSHLPAGATSSDGTAGSDNQSTADDAVPEDPSRPVDDGTAHGGSPDDHTQPADGERLAGQQTASGAQDGGRQQNSPTPQAGSPHAEADSPGSADR